MTRHRLFLYIVLAVPPWAALQLVPTPAYTQFETNNRLPSGRMLAEAGQIRRHEASIKPPIPWSKPEIAALHSTAAQPELLKSP